MKWDKCDSWYNINTHHGHPEECFQVSDPCREKAAHQEDFWCRDTKNSSLSFANRTGLPRFSARAFRWVHWSFFHPWNTHHSSSNPCFYLLLKLQMDTFLSSSILWAFFFLSSRWTLQNIVPWNLRLKVLTPAETTRWSLTELKEKDMPIREPSKNAAVYVAAALSLHHLLTP